MRFAVIALLLCSSVVCLASEKDEQAKSLKGLKAVAMEVDVRYLSTAKRYGLREYEIAKKMKDVLEESDITPLTVEQQAEDPNCPVLRITVIPMIDEKHNACSISIDVDLKQTVKLASDPSVEINGVATWNRNAVSLINTKMLLPGVSERVDTYLKEFINDWCAANGKEPKYETKDGKKKNKEKTV